MIWLPEDHVIKLTALEAGFLAGLVKQAIRDHPQLAVIQTNAKGRDLPMPILDRIFEKLEEEAARNRALHRP